MSDYTDYLQDVFAQFGPVSVRRMFGGHGIYHQGLMFALVADDMLYLKTDDGNVGDFERKGLEPFFYHKAGREVRMSYYRAPEAIFEDQELAVKWADAAFAAALRAKAGKH